MPKFGAKLKAAAESNPGAGTGGYLNPSKIAIGESVRFTFLPAEDGEQDYIEGYVVWGQKVGEKARKPFRFSDEPTEEDISAKMGKDYIRPTNERTGDLEPVKYFIACAIYDYDKKTVQVLEATQQTIHASLEDLTAREEDYPNLTETDLELKREKMSYSLIPVPRRRGTQNAISDAWAEALNKGFDLNRLFTGGNPFTDKE
jgi:hypothetical protein